MSDPSEPTNPASTATDFAATDFAANDFVAIEFAESEPTDTEPTVSEPAQTEPAQSERAKSAPAKSRPRRDRSWIVLGLSIAFVVSVVSAFSYLMRDSLTPDPVRAFDLKFTDNFNRRGNKGGLGTTAQGQEWTSVRGLWNLDAGRAVVALPDRDLSLAVIGTLQNGSVMAVISGKQTCGVVARYQDEMNFVALLRVPFYGVWNLMDVKDGKQTVLAKLPDVPGAQVKVKLETGGRVLNAYVGLNKVSVVKPAERTVGSVGFIGYSNAAIDCVWEDLWAFSGR